MRKIIATLISSIFLFCGCDYDDISPAGIATEQAEAVIECLKTGGTSKLEGMFCKSVAQKHDLHSEISEAIEFIDGNIIDDGRWIGLTENGRAIDNGKTTKLTVQPMLMNVKTDTGKEYLIIFTSYVIYDGKPNNIGITYISIKSDDERYTIGEAIY